MAPEITKEKLVEILDRYLLGWEYEDIVAAAINGPAKMAGFILGCCFIDAMAGFYSGIDKETCKTGSGGRFKIFVEKYMVGYDPETLYLDLRNYLVHSYTEGGTYVFTDANKHGVHFGKTGQNRIVLNLEDFCADLNKAYKLLRSDILNDEIIFNNAKVRYLSLGLLQIIQ